jgi:hypothetical protein
MKIVGCDLHTRYQQIAMLDEETGELVERRLEHGGWRTLNNPRMWVAHPSAFFAEGWVTANLDRRTGCRILSS